LSNFGGSAIIVSHDRWFLDRVATSILAFEEDGSSTFFPGSYSMYEEEKRKRLGASYQPHRVKHKKIKMNS